MPYILNGTKCYSSKEAAEKADVSLSYIARIAKKHQIDAILFRGVYFFPVKSFVEWQARRKKPGRPRKIK
jgi:hypothetical protein